MKNYHFTILKVNLNADIISVFVSKYVKQENYIAILVICYDIASKCLQFKIDDIASKCLQFKIEKVIKSTFSYLN